MSKIINSSTEYTGKNTIYEKMNGYHGLCYIWDWNEEKKRYEKRQSGLKYYAYKKLNGLQKAKCFESFDQAKKWRDSSSFFYVDTDHEHMLFGEVKKKYFEHISAKIRPSTFESYENTTKHLSFFERLPMSQINSKAIDCWLEHVKKPEYLVGQHKTRLSYQKELSLLRQILVYFSEYLCDTYQTPLKKRHIGDAILNNAKFNEARAKNKGRYLSNGDIEAFLQEYESRAETKDTYWMFYSLMRFQLRTGVRIGEACALSFSDVNLQTKEVSISKTVFWARRRGRESKVENWTKTGNNRVIFATDEIIEMVKELSVRSKRTKGLIFSFDGFSPLTYRSIQHHNNSVFKAIGSPFRSTHIMRHTFATQFLELTGNPHALKGMMGHTKIMQSEHYAKTTAKTVLSGFNAFEDGLKGQSNVVEMPVRLGMAGNN